ncbi:MAG: DNA modification methylase [Verrucomicrobia bacterium]|nr:DNA modification methylase [Verrucomicrobiota bacterium]
MSAPIHRWFRYSAGFSGEWANEVIAREKSNGRRHVLDPFAGSGTVLIEAERREVEARGIEAHPFVHRIGRAKLLWRDDWRPFWKRAGELARRAASEAPPLGEYPPLVYKCFPEDTLRRLNALRFAWQSQADGSPISELLWLALTACLRECSPVGTAQWQYILPNKTKARALDPVRAFEAKAQMFVADMQARQRQPLGPPAVLAADDARECDSVPDRWADLVITSPPYANNYDYADATRLEMSFFGEVSGWGDLQEAVRRHLVRSCTQHVSALETELDEYLAGPLLAPIVPELKKVCGQLAREREGHGGKKAYHLMVAGYFSDLARVWKALRRVTADDARVCFVVGDSAPYGIYVPVDRWLGELALASGFKSLRFEKTRDRNTKWKNRKHRVPLHEGRLWVEG